MVFCIHTGSRSQEMTNNHNLIPFGYLTRSYTTTMVNAFNKQRALFRMTIAVVLAINVDARLEHKSGVDISEIGRFLQSNQFFEVDEKELQMQNTPKEINVDPRSTYNEKFMTLMSSPCRPEYDGFFGATSGSPIRIQYGFQLEVQPLSAIMDILDIIEDKIVDSILQSSFPEMCGLRRARKTEELSRKLFRRLKDSPSGEMSKPRDEESRRSLAHVDGHPSGFRFLKFEEVAKCLPQVNEVNFCGIFTGVVYVYGKHQYGEEASRVVMSYIDQVLDTSVPQELHSELALISSADEFSTIEGNDTNRQSIPKEINHDVGGGLSRLDILLIIISGLIFLAIVYYFYIQWSERRYDDPKSSVGGSSLTKDIVANNDPKGKSSHLSIESEGDDYIEDEFIDEDLGFEPYKDDRVNNGVLL